MYSKIGNRPVIHISYPVFGHDGTRMGFIMVGMDLTRMQERIMRTRDDEAATICVLDSRGTVLARNVDPVTWIGVDMAEDARIAEMLAQPEGMGEVEGFEGVAQLCAYTRADDVPWFVRVCVDSASVRSQADAELRGYFAVFLPLTLLALGGWLWLGHDVDRMHRETERLALIDQLTGLWNSRSMRDDITRTFEQAVRTAGEADALVRTDIGVTRVLHSACDEGVGNLPDKLFVLGIFAEDVPGVPAHGRSQGQSVRFGMDFGRSCRLISRRLRLFDRSSAGRGTDGDGGRHGQGSGGG